MWGDKVTEAERHCVRTKIFLFYGLPLCLLFPLFLIVSVNAEVLGKIGKTGAHIPILNCLLLLVSPGSRQTSIKQTVFAILPVVGNQVRKISKENSGTTQKWHNPLICFSAVWRTWGQVRTLHEYIFPFSSQSSKLNWATVGPFLVYPH